MTLARTALRLAGIETWRGQVHGSRQPIIAENRVYDSRISDFSPETFPDDARSTIIVLTVTRKGTYRRGGPPFRWLVNLVAELVEAG